MDPLPTSVGEEQVFEIKLGGWVGHWSVSNILGPMVTVRCEGAMRGKSLEEGDGSPEELAHKLMAGIVADPLFELGLPGGEEDPDFAEKYPFISTAALDKYHQALGRFQQKCGQAEVNLNLVIRQLQNSKKAQAPLRFGDAMKAIRKAIRVAKAPREVVSEVEHVLKHLQQIVVFRNRIDHNGASPATTNKQGWFYIDSGGKGAHVRTFFKRQTLDNITADLWALMNYLPVVIKPLPPDVQRPEWKFHRDQLKTLTFKARRR